MSEDGADPAGVQTDKFEELEAQFQQQLEKMNRKWQSKVDQILTEKKELESRVDKDGLRAQELDRRERVLNLAVEKGVDPATAMTLISGSDEDRLDAFNSAVENVATSRLSEEIGRRFPNRPKPKGNIRNDELTYTAVETMSDDQIAALPDYMFNAAMNQGSKVKPTLRDRLSKAFKGAPA